MTKNEETRLRNLQTKQAQGKRLKPLDVHFLNTLGEKKKSEEQELDYRTLGNGPVQMNPQIG